MRKLILRNESSKRSYYRYVHEVWGDKHNVLQSITNKQYDDEKDSDDRKENGENHEYRWHIKTANGDHRICSWEETIFWISVFNEKDLNFLAKEMWNLIRDSVGIDRVLDIPMVCTVYYRSSKHHILNLNLLICLFGADQRIESEE